MPICKHGVNCKNLHTGQCPFRHIPPSVRGANQQNNTNRPIATMQLPCMFGSACKKKDSGQCKFAH